MRRPPCFRHGIRVRWVFTPLHARHEEIRISRITSACCFSSSPQAPWHPAPPRFLWICVAMACTTPLAVTVVPHFSWRLESEVRGQAQSAWQILVASSAELLAQDRGDLWDSGKTASGRERFRALCRRSAALPADVIIGKSAAGMPVDEPSEWSKARRDGNRATGSRRLAGCALDRRWQTASVP